MSGSGSGDAAPGRLEGASTRRRLVGRARSGRRRVLGLLGAGRDDPVHWGQVTKAALATAIAWEVATRLLGSTTPVFAPLAAMLTVQVTVYESVQTAVQRTLGVVAGVLLAFALARLLGLHSWSIALVVLLGLALGQAVALGTQGSTQVSVSALLVLAIGAATPRYAEGRVLDTLVGAAVGVLVNLVLAPPATLRDSGRAVRRLAEGQARLLRGISEGLEDGWPGPGAADRLEQARGLDKDLRRARAAVEQGSTSLRWNLRARRRRPAAAVHRDELRALEHVSVQLRGVARTLADEAEHAEHDPGDAPPPELRRGLADLAAAAAAALESLGSAAVDDAGRAASRGPVEAVARQVGEALEASRRLTREARATTLPTRTWLVLGSVLTDLRRLLAELDGENEPLDLTLEHRPVAVQVAARRRRRAGRGPRP